MKQSWVWWIAGRFVRTRRREKKNIISILSIVGLGLGVATLINVMAAMNGFQSGTLAGLMDLQSLHLRVEGPLALELSNQPQAIEQLQKALPGTRSIAAYGETRGLAKGQYNEPVAIDIRGIPVSELPWILTNLPQVQLHTGSESLIEADSIAIGRRLAWSLGLKTGDILTFVSMEGGEAGVQEYQLQVSAVLNFGNSLLDSSWAFVPRQGVLAKVLDQNAFIGLRINSIEADREAAQNLSQIIDQKYASAAAETKISTWREYNRSIFGVLRMEKLVMFLVIALVFIVVGMNIFHDLRVSVLEKQEELGVLRAMGASPWTLQSLFIFQGLIIGCAGGICGFGLGVLLAQNLNGLYSILVSLIMELGLAPAQAFLPNMPIDLHWDESIGIALFAAFAAMVAAWLASRSVSVQNAASILRYE